MALTKEQKKRWQAEKDKESKALIAEAMEQGLPESGPVYSLFKKGMERALDEKYSKAEDKENAIRDGINLDLASLVAKARGEKEELVAEYARLHGIEPDMLNKAKYDTETWREKVEAAKARFGEG